MAKEVILYGDVNEYSASIFLAAMGLVSDEDSLNVRINTNGGNPGYGWGIVAKFAEHKGEKKVSVDGRAYSMGTYFLCYADNAEALDVSEFLIHRAAYPSWVESNPDYFDETTRAQLARTNASLKKALFNKIDSEKLQVIMDSKPELNGAKVKDIFSMDQRLDVFLTAKEAKEIGLINKINKITPEIKASIDSKMLELAATFKMAAEHNPTPNPTNIMTLEKIKAENPALYSQIIALGVAQEQDRVGAWMAFVDVDAKSVADGIKSNLPISMTATAELSRKSFSVEALKKLTEEGKTTPAAGATAAIEATAKTDAQKELDAYDKEVKAQLKGTSTAFVSKTAEV